jgi:LacI family transcriptional regulator, galactose operon repressor
MSEASKFDPRKRPTLKTISQLSGLAVPTVSRALSDAPDISDKTKKKVRKIAQEIGYQPNRAGLRLRTGKTNVIALILSTDFDMMNHTAGLITSIAAATRSTPYHLIVTPYFPDEDPMNAVRYVVETRSADGMILNQIQPRDPRVAYLLEQGFPVATHGRTDWCDRHPYYDFDNAAFGQICVERLVAQQRRNIIVVAPPMEQNYSQNLMEGVFRTAETLSVRVQRMENITSDSTTEQIIAAVSERFENDPTIDGIICPSTTSAMASVVAVEQTGRQIGREVDLTAKEAIPFLKSFRKAILPVFEDFSKAGDHLAKAIFRAIDHPDLPPIQELDIPEMNMP